MIAKKTATISALRLRESGKWNNYAIGHSSITHNASSLPIDTDYCVPKLNFNKAYKVIIPLRDDWKRRPHQVADTINIFTDGSKLQNNGYIHQKWVDIYDCFHCSVYQAKVTSIQEAMTHIAIIRSDTRIINLFSDSQADLKVLDSCVDNSKTTM